MRRQAVGGPEQPRQAMAADAGRRGDLGEREVAREVVGQQLARAPQRRIAPRGPRRGAGGAPPRQRAQPLLQQRVALEPPRRAPRAPRAARGSRARAGDRARAATANATSPPATSGSRTRSLHAGGSSTIRRASQRAERHGRPSWRADGIPRADVARGRSDGPRAPRRTSHPAGQHHADDVLAHRIDLVGRGGAVHADGAGRPPPPARCAPPRRRA